MIAKVTRGGDIRGLVRYLFGAGKFNEHTGQRVVAADDSVDVPVGVALSGEERRSLGEALDAPYRLYGAEVPRGYSWHVSLTTKAGADGELSDAEWAEIATEAMDRLGFSAGEGRAGCRWVAVRHGLSEKGNDHIHIAVDVVREDGTVAKPGRDYVVLSGLCADMERRFGLTVVEGRKTGGMPGLTRAEIERAGRAGRSQPERVEMARRVRAAAVASVSEDEFVRRLRRAGMAVRPRLSRGLPRQVVGYAVAVRPGDGGQMLWWSGSSLAADLGLPRLREQWAAQGGEVVAEWGEDTHRARPRAGRHPKKATWEQADAQWGSGQAATDPKGRERAVYAPEQWHEAAGRLGRVFSELHEIPAEDRAGWESVANQAAGVLGSLSARIEPDGGPIGRAADALARSAQRADRDTGGQPGRPPSGTLRTVAAVMAQAQITDEVAVAWQMLLGELLKLADAIRQAHLSRGELAQAGRLAEEAQQALEDARSRYATAQRVSEVLPRLLDDIEAVRAEEEEERDEGRGRHRRRGSKPSTTLRPSELEALAAQRDRQAGRDPARGPER